VKEFDMLTWFLLVWQFVRIHLLVRGCRKAAGWMWSKQWPILQKYGYRISDWS
jgi:hypothetical protein